MNECERKKNLGNENHQIMFIHTHTTHTKEKEKCGI